ncbi:hypothetical protein [Patulibacter defluvii]|uniref:hypothetical protein n=1 Tax=Patulibacter defluvii TaxID=3095358 RepID=UPI002A766073|nr:hypothetical protein [Patulibacter sp. DM4]
MSRRGRRALAAGALLLATVVAPAHAAAATPALPPLAAEARQLAIDDAGWWAAHQQSGGTFPERLRNDRPTNGYGRVMLGYGLLRAGTAVGRETPSGGALWAAGDRALSPQRQLSSQGFRGLAAAFLHRDVPDAPPAARRWAATYLQRFRDTEVGPRAVACKRDPRCYSNLKLLEALDVLLLTRSGLTSNVPGSRLASAAASRRWAAEVIERRVPAIADGRLRARTGGATVRGSVLSDPPNDPLAYHALSTWMLAQSVAELGASASSSARRALRETLDALSVLIAPDGEIAWYGRGQAQVWTLAMAAAAGAEGARAFRGQPALAGRYLAVTRVALQRLRERHRESTGLLALVDTWPGGGSRRNVRGIDPYAGSVVYGGLAQLALWKASDAIEAIPGLAAGPLPADDELRVSDPRASRLAVVRRGRVWFGVHAVVQHPRDLRYDFGLLRLKLRGDDGGWRDLLAPRPLTETGNATTRTAGPTLTVGGRTGYPEGRTIGVASDGTVSVRGGFRTADGAWLRQGVRFAYRPLATGLRLTVSGLAGGTLRVRTFGTRSGLRRRDDRTLVADGTTIRFDRAARFSRVQGGFHSGPLPDLAVVDAQLPVRGSSATVTYDGG